MHKETLKAMKEVLPIQLTNQPFTTVSKYLAFKMKNGEEKATKTSNIESCYFLNDTWS